MVAKLTKVLRFGKQPLTDGRPK